MFGKTFTRKKTEPRKPRVGDLLWYHPNPNECGPSPDDQPLAALVAHVNCDGTLNLSVFNVVGTAHSRESVLCVPEARMGCAEWPYEEKA